MKKIGHRRVTVEGTVTYKKTPTSDIQRAIQLGIQHSIGTLQQKPVRDVLYRDFEVIETVDFPRSGTKTTPAHNLSDFKFRTYAPVAFRSFRNTFKLDIRDFLNSLCIQELHELSNPGASGSIFYISADDEFIIKTLQHKEANFLQKLLPEYYMNLVQHTRTLLPKFYGLYCYQALGKNIRFVVMNNLLPSSITIHQKYDLKGSTYKRKASVRELAKSFPTLKDLDFKKLHPEGILLEAETHDALMKTIERDCLVLESFRIMDYSLLLGVHNLDQEEREKLINRDAYVDLEASPPLLNSTNNPIVHSNSSCDKVPSILPHPSYDNHPDFSTPGPYGEIETFMGNQNSPLLDGIQSPLLRTDFRGKSLKRLTVHSTAMESIEAKTEPVQLQLEEKNKILLGGLPARSSSGDRLFLYIGIIDILQSYRALKKVEHSLKSVITDAETVSVTHPAFYARRFQSMIGRTVFRKIQSPTTAVAFRRSSTRHKYISSAKTTIPAKNCHDITTAPRSQPIDCQTSTNQNLKSENPIQ